MFQVLANSWALMLGMFLLMIGNGLQGTLLGVRGAAEGFSTFSMSLVMSAYFLGFLIASRVAPRMIQRVGHVRVFAALGSTISAVLILYPALTEIWAWILGRVVIGFCFCGVYITAESWLNDASTNETRGKALSLYMIMQMAGITLAQYLLTLGDINGFVLFITASVLVSMAFAPILLSVGQAPNFSTTKSLSIRRLIDASPLACVGIFLLGGIFAAQFGMSAVYGAEAGLSVGQISIMVSSVYLAALVAQYPIGWLSDRIDRRVLILALAALGGLSALVPFLFSDSYIAILFAAAMVGGTSNPLYALLLAYANDYLTREEMPAASGGLLLINGLGAVLGPIGLGWVMNRTGPSAYWAVVSILMLALVGYGAWRSTRRSRAGFAPSEAVPYTPIYAASTAVATEAVHEIYAEETVRDAPAAE